MRVTPIAHAATPLGTGFGVTRFASPTKAFKVIYVAQDLTTAVAETLVRDRFQGRAQRKLLDVEAALWGMTEVNAGAPLMLIDLRTTGLVRLGVSTEAARGKAQGQGRKLSQAIQDQTDAQGLIYNSRLTGGACICIYDRALPGLVATPIVEVTRLAGFVDALRELNVTLIATPKAFPQNFRGSCEAKRPHIQATPRRVAETGFSNVKSAKSSMMGQSGR